MGNLGGLTKKTGAYVEGTKTISSAGTAEALSSSHIFCPHLTVQAQLGNTGTTLAVGSSAVVLSTATGAVLPKGNTIDFYGVYLDEIYVDVGTNGDKVSYWYKPERNL